MGGTLDLEMHEAIERNRGRRLALHERIEVADIARDNRGEPQGAGGIAPGSDAGVQPSGAGGEELVCDDSEAVRIAVRKLHVQHPAARAIERLEITESLRQFKHAERIRFARNRGVAG